MSKPRVFNADPFFAARFQPYIAAPPLCKTGRVKGINIISRAVERCNEWEMRIDGRIPVTTGRKTGVPGAGKTASIMIDSKRMLEGAAGVDSEGNPKPMRGRIEENKHEKNTSAFKNWCEFTAAELVKVDGLGVYNPFSYVPGMTTTDMLDRVIRTCEILNHNEELPNDVEYAMSVAIFQMWEHKERSGPGLMHQILVTADLEDEHKYREALHSDFMKKQAMLAGDVGAVRLDVANRHKREVLNLTEEDFRAACLKAQFFMHTLRHGRLSKYFGDGKGVDQLMLNDVTAIDWEGVSPLARAIITSGMWQTQLVHSRDPEKADLNPNYVYTDEGGKSAGIQSVLEYQVQAAKDARAFPTVLVQAAQFEYEDLIAVGEPGSRLRTLAESLAKTIGFREIFNIGELTDEKRHFFSGFGMASHDIELLSILPPGVMGYWLPNEDMRFIQMIPRPIEWEMIQSDGAAEDVLSYQGVWTIDKIIERAEALDRKGLLYPRKEEDSK